MGGRGNRVGERMEFYQIVSFPSFLLGMIIASAVVKKLLCGPEKGQLVSLLPL